MSAINLGAIALGVPLAANAQELIERPDIDCVYIATPPASHLSLIVLASAAGKSIFCEKPLAASIADLQEALLCVERSRVRAAVNFNYASAAAAMRMQELVVSNLLGERLKAKLTIRLRQWPRGWQTGATTWLDRPEQGGFTREIVSHFVFLAQRLFGYGTVSESNVQYGPYGTEQRLNASIVFERAVLEIDAAVEGEQEDYNRFEVVGSRASATISDWYRLESPFDAIEPQRPDRGQLDELASLLAFGESRLASFAEAAAVVKLIEGLLIRPCCNLRSNGLSTELQT